MHDRAFRCSESQRLAVSSSLLLFPGNTARLFLVSCLHFFPMLSQSQCCFLTVLLGSDGNVSHQGAVVSSSEFSRLQITQWCALEKVTGVKDDAKTAVTIWKTAGKFPLSSRAIRGCSCLWKILAEQISKHRDKNIKWRVLLENSHYSVIWNNYPVPFPFLCGMEGWSVMKGNLKTKIYIQGRKCI